MADAQTLKRPNAHFQNALIVFAKPPKPGQVKTRLTAVLSEREAARLYAAFLRDALDQFAGLAVRIRLYWSEPPSDDRAAFVPESVEGHLQKGNSLGARMLHAFRETLAHGFDRAVIIGTDHPTLPTAFIERAFAVLEKPRSVCIGPSDDGGYYLLGMNQLYPQLFADMSYSHADVFADTLHRAEQTNARLTVLPEWYDVDTPDGLQRLVSELRDADGVAPHTQQVVAELNLSERVPFG